MPADRYDASIVVDHDPHTGEALYAGVTVFSGQTHVHLELPSREYDSADDLAPSDAAALADSLLLGAATARRNIGPVGTSVTDEMAYAASEVFERQAVRGMGIGVPDLGTLHNVIKAALEAAPTSGRKGGPDA
jgi:hypothetical protein